MLSLVVVVAACVDVVVPSGSDADVSLGVDVAVPCGLCPSGVPPPLPPPPCCLMMVVAVVAVVFVVADKLPPPPHAGNARAAATSSTPPTPSRRTAPLQSPNALASPVVIVAAVTSRFSETLTQKLATAARRPPAQNCLICPGAIKGCRGTPAGCTSKSGMHRETPRTPLTQSTVRRGWRMCAWGHSPLRHVRHTATPGSPGGFFSRSEVAPRRHQRRHRRLRGPGPPRTTPSSTSASSLDTASCVATSAIARCATSRTWGTSSSSDVSAANSAPYRHADTVRPINAARSMAVAICSSVRAPGTAQ